MRITVIKDNAFVAVDGDGVHGVNLAQLEGVNFLGSSVRAIQWYGDFGDVELGDDLGRTTANVRITSMDSFNWILDAHSARKQQLADIEAAQELQRQQEAAALLAQQQAEQEAALQVELNQAQSAGA